MVFIIGVTYLKGDNQVTLDEDGYYKSTYAKISKTEWNRVNFESNRYKSPEELLLSVDKYVEFAQSYLGTENWIEILQKENGVDFDTTIDIRFTYDHSSTIGGGTTSSKYTPVIKINIPKFEINSDPILHEITHLVSPYPKSASLSEGLACYLQDNYGGNDSYSHQKHIELYLTPEYKNVIDFVGIEDSEELMDLLFSDSVEILAFYSLSSSYTTYLIDNYGIEKFMKLYIAETYHQCYINLYGKNRETLINEWLKHQNDKASI